MTMSNMRGEPYRASYWVFFIYLLFVQLVGSPRCCLSYLVRHDNRINRLSGFFTALQFDNKLNELWSGLQEKHRVIEWWFISVPPVINTSFDRRSASSGVSEQGRRSISTPCPWLWRVRVGGWGWWGGGAGHALFSEELFCLVRVNRLILFHFWH